MHKHTSDTHSHDHSKHDHKHGHAHGHTHGHGHHHGAATKNVLIIAVILAFTFAAIEAISGWWANSLTLLSDAGHMAADALSLVLAAIAAWIASKPPSKQHSYGLGRAEVIGAWISSILIVVIAVVITIEAIRRFSEPQEVTAKLVMIVGIIGIIINLLIAWVLSRGEQTLNIRAAILHVLGDLLGSAAAFVSGLIIHFTGWTKIDPILSVFICILILVSSFRLLRETLLVLMEGVPLHLDLSQVGTAMAEVQNVKGIHDLHIWTLSSGMIVLTAHVEIDEPNHWPTILETLRKLLAEDYSIRHITLQPESQVVQIIPANFKDIR